MSSDHAPQRISDAERDAAVEMLRQHFEAGRLDPSEFAERMETALSARFASDLAPLFVDLPHPRPTAGETVWLPWTAPPPAPKTQEWVRWVGILRASIWPIAILLGLITGELWIFILIALVVSTVSQGVLARHKQPPPELEK